MAWTLHEELMVLDQAGEVMLDLCTFCAECLLTLGPTSGSRQDR